MHARTRKKPAPEQTAPVLRHIYPPGSFNTIGGGIGAVALCGHIKQTPWSGRFAVEDRSPSQCVVCVDLLGGH